MRMAYDAQEGQQVFGFLDCHGLAEIKAAAPAAAWLGFVKLAGKPRYGAHVLLGPLQIHRQLAL